MIPNTDPSMVTPQPNPSYPLAQLNSSTYAAPLSYNQPTEVVGGYDAKINPMTGEELGQTNFAQGGHVPSHSGLASLVQSKGRGDDKILVHMTPKEVQGLQALAMAHGGSLTVNPETGLYEAGFLSKLLPTLLGFGLNFMFPGLGALGSAALVGAGETIRTGGDLGKGLMAGLGAFGGASLGAGLSAAGSAGAAGTTAGTTAGTAGAAGVGGTAGGAAAGFVPGGAQAAQAAADAATTGISALEPVAVTGKTIGSPSLFDLAKGAAANKGTSVGTEFLNLTGRNLSTMGRGIGALGSEAGRSAFMSAVPGGKLGLAAAGMGLANAATPDYKVPDLSQTIDRSYYESYGYSPEEGRFLGGEWRTGYPGFPGYAEGGDVDKDKPPAPTSSMSQYQSAPANAASFASYLQDLNKYVASPVAPPPRPTAPPPTDTAPVTPPRTGPGRRPDLGDFSGIDLSSINYGDFMAGGMNGLAGLIGDFQGNDGRRQWDPNTGSFAQPGMNVPPTMAPPTPSYAPPSPTYDQNPYVQPSEDYGYDYDFRPSRFEFSGGGATQYAAAGKLLRGPGDGMSDDIKANISGTQEARLADGEFVVPADVVSHLGNGSSEAGSRRLYKMMADIRKARTGRSKQAPAVNVDRHLPKA